MLISAFGFTQWIQQTNGTNPTCPGSAVVLNSSGVSAGDQKYWYLNNQYYTSTYSNSVQFTPTQTTIYKFCLIQTGSSCSAPYTVTVNPLPDNAGVISGAATVCLGQNSVTYTVPTIANAISYVWTLPNGSTGTSTTESITVSYGTSAVSGNITVKGHNSCGDGSVSTFLVTVNQLSAPTATNNGPVCIGNMLSLTASSVTGATYSWIGPNGFTSSEQNPIISTSTTLEMAGNYIVTTSLINGCTSSSGSTTVVINQATAGNNGPVCAGQTLSLSASAIPGATYYWTGPNGFSSTQQNPTVTTAATSAMAGVYSVYTTANGCTSPTPGTTTVVVNSIPATPTAGNNGPVCVGNTLSLTASTVTGATYLWTGANSYTSTQQNPTVSTSATSAMGGVYNVTATVNGCASVAGTTTVEINKITASNNGPVCVGNTLSLSVTTITGATYAWTGQNSFTSTQQNPTVSASATSAMAGVYSVTSTANGCASAASVTIVTINSIVAAPTVTSPVTYCQNATASPLSANGSSLLWYTTSTGSTGSSTAPTPITSIAGTTTYYVSQTVSCESSRANINVIVNPLPATAGTITGTATVCQGQNFVTYTVPIITNATTYVWTLPTGATGTSTTNSIIVSFGTSAISGNITVKGNNSCGNGILSTYTVTVNPLPVSAGTITGTASVCQGQNSVNYTVPTITNATTYIWALPTGATGTSTTNSITVDYGTSAASGNITVKGNNSCGDGAISTLAITVIPPPASAGTISGTATVCLGQNSVTYSVPTIANATSYVWTLPSGATGTSTTNSIIVNYGTSAVSGNITVKGHNSCVDGATSTLAIIVSPLPSSAGTISGTTTVCQGQNSVIYAVPSITNATSYVWTLPSGATGTSTTNNITVNYGTSAVSGNITVKGNNSCGNGTISTYAITVNPLPANAGVISGLTTIPMGQSSVTYTVPAIANATSYIWTLPSGATGSSATNSITVDFSMSAISGNITVKGSNSCGDGVVSTLTITVSTICTNDTIISIANLPAVKTESRAISYNSDVYIFGGGNNSVITNTTYKYSTFNNIWSTLATMLTARAEMGVAEVNGIVYCIGGWTGSVSNKNEAYNISLNTWQTMANIPNAITCCYATSLNNKVYVIGSTLGTTTNYFYSYDPNTNSYSTLSTPTQNRGNARLVTYNNKIYLVGGSYYNGSYNTSNKLDEYNPSTNTWTSKASIPISIQRSGVTIYNNKIYLFGGSTTSSTITPLNSFYVYDFISNAWTTMSNLPFSRSSMEALTVNNIVYLFGGNINSNTVTDLCYKYYCIDICQQLLPASAGTITGITNICQGQNSVTYTVPTITNATSYVWTLPSGATGTSATNSISIDYGASAVSGNITVKGNNSCGDGVSSTLAITVNPLPIIAGTITGASTVCQGQNSVTYTVPTITNATSYVWSLPSGATGTSTTNSIIVSYGASAVSGNITVKGHNSCGDGATSTLAITVNPLPVSAGTITGASTVCQGQNSVTYTVPSITNATSYVWTLPSGATGTSATNSITVSYGTSAISGNITVKGTNTCGNGSTSTFAITVNPVYSFTENNSICNGETYNWHGSDYSIAGSYYDSLLSISGCDSVYALNLSVISVDTSLTVSDPVISSNASGVSYQWLDCNNAFASIIGETSQSYTATANGNFAVKITQGLCSDTSACVTITSVGIASIKTEGISIYPNPVNNELTIIMKGNKEKINFEILNIVGQVVFKGYVLEKAIVKTSSFLPDIYILKFENGTTYEFKKIVKE